MDSAPTRLAETSMRNMFRSAPVSLVLLTALALAGQARAQAQLIGPLPYLSEADSPLDLSGLGTAAFLETFEDRVFDVPGVSVSAGVLIGYPSGSVDSVDGDDGAIDGSGLLGASWFVNPGSIGMTFTFDAAALGNLPAEAGLAWTDGFGTIVFEAFDENGQSLGVLTGNHSDGGFNGTTGDDRFYGVRYAGGISAIRIYNTSGGMEVDHLQYRIGPAADHLAFDQEPDTVQRAGDTWPPITVRLEDVNGQLVTGATDVVTVSLTQGGGILGGTLSKAAVGGLVTFDDLAYDTPETIRVVFDSPDYGGIARTFLITPVRPDLRITPDDVSFVPAAPAVGEPTTISAVVRNVGADRCDAQVSFHLGDPDFGGTLLGTAPVQTIGVGGNATFTQAWTPSADGLQSIFVVVDNLSFTDTTPADNRAAASLPVGAAPEELQVHAGERIAWPGAVSSAPVTVTNVGAGPATITGASLGPPSWLTLQTPNVIGATLQPGESILVLVELAVPAGTPGGPLNGTPLTQEVPVAFDTASGSFSGELVVKLFDQAASQVTVRVVDDVSGNPIGNALVAAQDLPGSFVTGVPSGEVTLQLPPGPNGLFAFRTAFIARAETVDVPEGTSVVELRLTPGQTLEVEQVVSEPLSTQEILDRGIQVNDPVNNDVFDFVVSMQTGQPLVLPAVELPKVQPTSGSVTFSGFAQAPVPPPTSTGQNGYGTGSVLVVARFDYNQFGRTETWIIIPGQVWVLKQFFEVTTFVFNNAQARNPEDVQLRNVQADLNLAAGLGLPDLEGVPQQLSQSLPDLDAQEGASAVWIVRGDAPGSYQLNGLVTADLFAFGSQQATLSALATSDPFEVTRTQIRCEFFTPAAVQAGAPFTFGVLVTNEGAAPAQLVRVILEEADLVLCSLVGTAALQRPEVSFGYDASMNVLSATFTIGDLDPGTSGLAEFELISEVDGVVTQVGIENGCGAAPSPPVEVVAAAPRFVDQPDPVTVCEGAVATFQITADGSPPITYQWRKDSVDLLGETGVSLTISSATLADAGSYDCVATNPGGSTTSAAAILTVEQPPAITDPSGATVCAGDAVAFTVVVTGNPGPTVQWYRDGNPIPGATAATHSIAAATAADAGQYTCIATNPCGSVTSGAAALVVQQPPVITGDPNGQLVTEGDAVTFSVTATAAPAPTYQWHKDGAPLAGATAPTLTIASVMASDAGSYSCVVSNACGSVTSAAASLTVNFLPVINCSPTILWSPKHDLVDVSGGIQISDPDGDPLNVSFEVYSDEPEIPDTGDGTGNHAPDFKDERGGRGLLLRSERQGPSDGRFYIMVIRADDGRGGIVEHACIAGVCPHDQNDPASLTDVLNQAAVGRDSVQAALDSGVALPTAGLHEHGVAAPLGPKQ